MPGDREKPQQSTRLVMSWPGCRALLQWASRTGRGGVLKIPRKYPMRQRFAFHQPATEKCQRHGLSKKRGQEAGKREANDKRQGSNQNSK